MSAAATLIVIVAAQKGPRLEYICDWIFRERLKLPYSLVTMGEAPLPESAFILHYGLNGEWAIPASGILSARAANVPTPEWTSWNDLPVCFPIAGDYALPFDFFGAVFYLLSRMEEYAAYTPDRHGRFPAEASCLFQQQLLERPIVDEWIQTFGEWLVQNGVSVPKACFQFLASYDIDIAWSYRHKGFFRNAGGWLRDCVKGEFARAATRMQVLSGLKHDPYDSFDFLNQLHQQYGLTPVYFLLAALRPGPFDKNITPRNPAMRQLIQLLADACAIAVHPSYESAERPELFAQELQVLQQISGQTIRHSRQHYIRFRLPETFRQLAGEGIQEEYSMGYGTHLGFRAGTGSSFLWYDVMQESLTGLRIHPFCFMDTTAHYEASLTVAEAFARLQSMRSLLEKSGSTLVTVFHNFSLGTDPEWRGWREAYEQFIKDISR